MIEEKRFSLREHLENEIKNILQERDLYEEFHELLFHGRHDPEYDPTLDLIDCAERIGKIKAYQKIIDDLTVDIWLLDKPKGDEPKSGV